MAAAVAAALPPVVPAEAVVLGLLACSDQRCCPQALTSGPDALSTCCDQLHALPTLQMQAVPEVLVAPEAAVVPAVSVVPVVPMVVAAATRA